MVIPPGHDEGCFLLVRSDGNLGMHPKSSFSNTRPLHLLIDLFSALGNDPSDMLG